MKDPGQWRKVMLLCGLMCMVLASCDRSTKSVTRANKTLSGIKLPSLPQGVTDVRCATSGLFAKFVNVKFAASREQAREYLVSCAVPHYFEFSMINGKYALSATHVLTTPPEVTAVNGPAALRLGRGIGQQAWFKSVYGIRHGWFYRFEKHPVRYQLYYDLDAEQFYIYWSYS